VRTYTLTFVNAVRSAIRLTNLTRHPTGERQGATVEFLGIADFVSRWKYTRQGVHKVVASAGFPKPAFAVNNDRTKVWALQDVRRYETLHPELTSLSYKTQKQVGFFRAKMKGPQQQNAA
jgi:hypothetical protein